MAKREDKSHSATYLGDELKRVRITAGFTTHDALAAKMGYDRTLITKVEGGERPPTVDVLIAWCRACGLTSIPPEWVVGLAKRAGSAIPSWLEGWLKAEARPTRYACGLPWYCQAWFSQPSTRGRCS